MSLGLASFVAPSLAAVAVVWLVLVVGGLLVAAAMMTNRTEIAMMADQTGCRRGQARFVPVGGYCCGMSNGGPVGLCGWPGGVDMKVPSRASLRRVRSCASHPGLISLAHCKTFQKATRSTGADSRTGFLG
jgi:hypothetical protein